MQQTSIREAVREKFPGLSFHEAAANFLIGQWPRATIHDPETYTKSIARILAGYKDDVVVACIDPASGLATQCERLPNMKQVYDFLAKQSARVEQAEHYKQMPKPTRSHVYAPPNIGPNLFVPSDNPRYAEMLDMAKHPVAKELQQFRAENGHLCADGVRRDGIWVPLSWYEAGRASGRMRRVPASDVQQRAKTDIVDDASL